MTDAETIKGLECHIGNTPQDACDFCPYHKYGATSCLEMLLQDATALAIRKNAEIERLNSDITSLSNTIQNLLLTVSKTKESAIKEFWDELKKRNTMDERIVSVVSGDRLIMEMRGVQYENNNS